jgi:membrane protein DedA with SNARE-associated domain
VLVAGITSSITSFVGDHSLAAILLLLMLAAVFPAASELVMLYGGAVAAGAFAGAHVVLFGNRLENHTTAYLAIAAAGVAGNLVGAVIGWAIGWYGGRPLLKRHGRFLHVSPAKLDRAGRWFERNGSLVVLIGFAMPFVRSFVAIPAGVARVPLGRFVAFAFVGCAAFCFALAGAGWAVGSSYSSVRRYLDYVIAAGIVGALAYLLVRRRWFNRLRPRGANPAD